MPSIAPGNEPNSVHTINWPESDTQLKISAWFGLMYDHREQYSHIWLHLVLSTFMSHDNDQMS